MKSVPQRVRADIHVSHTLSQALDKGLLVGTTVVDAVPVVAHERLVVEFEGDHAASGTTLRDDRFPTSAPQPRRSLTRFPLRSPLRRVCATLRAMTIPCPSPLRSRSNPRLSYSTLSVETCELVPLNLSCHASNPLPRTVLREPQQAVSRPSEAV